MTISAGIRIGLAVLAIPVASALAADSPRLVSLGPALTDQVCLLGLASNLVGVTSFCRLPAGMPALPHVGTVTGINAEEVLSLRPDFVLATGMTHPRDTGKLEQLGLRVVRFGYARTFDEICVQFLDLGGLVGATNAAMRVVTGARGRLSSVRDSVAGKQAPRVFVEIGTKPLFTADRESFIHDMVERAGGVNIAADSRGGFYSREQVLVHDPEVILIVTMGVSAEEEQEAWLNTPSMQVSRTKRVHVLDAYAVCSPTPLGFVESAEAMARLFHPAGAQQP